MNASMKVLAAVLIAVALALAGLAARLAMRPAVPAPAERAPTATTHPVVVTARAVPAGQLLVAGDLRVEHFPVRPAGAHADPARLLGQRPALDLGIGVPVLDAMTSTGLAQRVATGERAVAVRVDETIGIGHRVRPGDRIDLFLLLKQDGREIGFTQARLLLPALRVLAYGDASVDGPAQPTEATQREPQPRRDAARTAVLSVPLAQVSQLLLGAGAGQLAMALRHPDDAGQPSPAFTMLPTALALPAPHQGDPAAADRAAAGVRLDVLAGAALAPDARRPSGVRPVAVPTGTAVRRASTSQGTASTVATRTRATPPPAPDRVEVIRPGGRESISY